ncbi:helix-turn-helix domain-containing protein [Flavobacterium macrobrachii]|uniref:Helix-turn-helix domain-containing protein n=1 Tax=Flavobacterium macrobrachii TaxID=591204 RepID=A0ABS2CWM1_9FLAO|nr:helix-turn-helix domain-containing protein [Flavobacterium macrobrachii]MBM6498989.1 helix-turn-helix domain-containing protein [Flavobacterium macrobrachii]
MSKQILQIENTNAVDFKNDILKSVKDCLMSFAKEMQNSDDAKLLSRQETSKMLSISLVTLWDWTNKDIIPAYRIGNKVFYKKNEVLEALQKRNNFKNQ